MGLPAGDGDALHMRGWSLQLLLPVAGPLRSERRVDDSDSSTDALRVLLDALLVPKRPFLTADGESWRS